MTQPFNDQGEVSPGTGEPARKPGRNLVGGTVVVLAVAAFVAPSEEYVREKLFQPTIDQAVDFIDTVLPG